MYKNTKSLLLLIFHSFYWGISDGVPDILGKFAWGSGYPGKFYMGFQIS